MSYSYNANSGYFGGGGGGKHTKDYEAPFRGGAGDNQYGDFNSGYQKNQNNIEKAKLFEPTLCSVHEQPIYQICLDKNCSRFFEPSCEKCVEQYHIHSANYMWQQILILVYNFKDLVLQMSYLKNILIQWSEQTQSANPELQNHMPQAIFELQYQLVKSIEDIIEGFIIVKNKIVKKMEEFYPKRNPKFMIKEYIKDIFNNPYDNFLKENIQKIKKLVDVDDKKNIKVVEQNSQKGSKFQQSNIYLKKLQKIVVAMNEQVDILNKESDDLLFSNAQYPWMRGSMKYGLQKIASHNSQSIKEIFKGTTFEATHNGYQILLSQTPLSDEHTMYIRMEAVNQIGYQNIMYAGIYKDSENVMVSKSYQGALAQNGCRKCIFNPKLENQMYMVEKNSLKNTIGSVIDDGDVLKFYLNVKQGYFEVSITKQDKDYSYKSNEDISDLIKNNQWRFALEFYNCDSKIRLMDSE